MEGITVGAIVLVVLGAVVGYLLNRHGPRIERRVTADRGVRTTVEADAEAPVRVETDPAVFESGRPNWEGYGYLFPERDEPPPSPPGDMCREWRAWAREGGAIDAQTTKVQVIVQGTAERVTIDRVEVELLTKDAPIAGVHALCPAGGASASPREVMVNLDAERVKPEYFAEGGTPAEPFLFTLEKDEAEVFRIYAFCVEHYCEWIARIHYVADGRRLAIEVTDDDGKPFRTSGIANAATYAWSQGGWEASSDDRTPG